MKCEDYRVLIEDYVDGSLDHKSAARVTLHTTTCVECARFYQELSREQELYARYTRDVEVTPVPGHRSRPGSNSNRETAGIDIAIARAAGGSVFGARLSPAFAAALVIVGLNDST
jgi:anti-sigma factor RsiW